MRSLIGTSGFSFDEWKGAFYPRDLPGKKMLSYYAERLPTVEINNTFYRTPKPEMLAGWAGQVPEHFRFAIKAPRRITHQQKLRDSVDSLNFLFSACSALGPKLGPILFQLPPSFKKDAGLLREFLSLVKAVRAAFEFRHTTWFDDEVYGILSDAGVALVSGDPDEADESLPLIPTARWGYLRLRADTYEDAALAEWSKRIAAQPWDEAFVYLKHEVRGPEFAQKLTEHLSSTDAKPA